MLLLFNDDVQDFVLVYFCPMIKICAKKICTILYVYKISTCNIMTKNTSSDTTTYLFLDRMEYLVLPQEFVWVVFNSIWNLLARMKRIMVHQLIHTAEKVVSQDVDSGVKAYYWGETVSSSYPSYGSIVL